MPNYNKAVYIIYFLYISNQLFNFVFNNNNVLFF